MSIPGQVVFIYAADIFHQNRSTLGPVFVFSYLVVSLVQVSFNELYYILILLNRIYKLLIANNLIFDLNKMVTGQIPIVQKTT